MAVKQTVRSEVGGGVRRIVLDRPERRNAIDGVTARALHAAVREAATDADTRVVVLAGAGPSFCAGWDVDAIDELRSAPRAMVRAELDASRRLLDDLAGLPQPTVAAVHGAVIGFGIGLVAACDLAIAGAETVVALPEVAHGIVPGMVLVDLLETVGPRTAADWLLTARRVSAAEAAAAGLFGSVVAEAALDEAVDAAARLLAAHDPAAAAGTKRLLRRVAALDREAAVDEAVEAAVAALLS